MSHTISFRIDDYYLTLLNSKVKQGESRHERARRILLDALDSEGQEEIKEGIREISEKVESLQYDLALAMEALLVTTGNFSKEKARDWVNRNMRERKRRGSS